MNMDIFEQRVRDRAYLMWEAEGRPAGRDAEHWFLSIEATRAELEAAAEPAPKKAAKPAAPRKKAAPKARAAASIAMSASL